MPERISGKCGQLWVSADATTPPIATDLVVYLSTYELGVAASRTDVTAGCDEHVRKVVGPKEHTGSFGGFMASGDSGDPTEPTLWQEALGGDFRLCHLYPTDPATDDRGYWSFLGSFDARYSGAVDGAWEVAADMECDGPAAWNAPTP